MALAGPDPPGRHDTVHGAEGPVDLAVALRWLGGDQALLRELVGIFVDDGPKRLEALREAMKAADVQQLEQVAHKIGRASCREREEIEVGGGEVKQKGDERR